MPDIDTIKNFYAINENLATGGQPTEAQLEAVRDAGYEVVINLGMPGDSDGLAGEDEIVEALGMEYISIPVEWEDPRLLDLWRFFHAMDDHRDRRVFVHCIANYRVAAFVYLYRRLRLEADIREAHDDMTAVWKPNRRWDHFVQQAMIRRDDFT